MKSFKTASASLALLTALAATAGTAAAQERTTSANVFTDVVVSTATKKADAENVQDIPIAITTLGAETLEALKVRDLEQLAFTAPNVTLDDVGTTRGTANFSIRGLGINSSIPSIDPTVGVFQDGVYFGVNSNLVFDLFDLDSVEVLRGPQGLLFGRNTTGGAVLINTSNPTDEFKFKFRHAIESPLNGEGGLATYSMGTITGPIVKDVLHGKIAAYYNDDDGYFKNQFDGSRQGEAQTYILRGGLEFFPTDNLTISAKGEYFNSEGDGPVSQNRGLFERDSFDFSIDEKGFYDSTSYFGTLRADWDVAFGNGTITNIFGYRDLDNSALGDIDATPVDLFHSPSELRQQQYSNELRYAGTFGDIDLTTGVYYFDQDVAYDEFRELFKFTGAGAPPTFYGGGKQDHKVFGAFANIDYAVTDDLTVTAGLRYSDEEKEAAIVYIQPRPECSVVESTCPFEGVNPFTGAPDGYRDEDSWSNFTPKLGVQYQINDNAQAYGSYTKGFRSGGYNFRITNVPVFLDSVADRDGQFSFDEEEVNAFELGTKFTSEDRRFNLNAAAFYTDISDMQREVNISDPVAGILQNILNTADATIMGIEFDGRATLTDWITLTGTLGYIDASYDDVRADISGDGVVNDIDEDLDLPRVPELSYGVGAIVDIPVSERSLVTARGNFSHRDRFAYTDSNLGFVQDFDRLDASLTWSSENSKGERFSLGFFGRNLLNEVQVGGDTQLPSTFGAAFGGAFPNQTGVATPFADNPQFGTFSPLKKGKVFGIELTVSN